MRPKKQEEDKALRTGFSYPVELKEKVQALAKARRLSGIIQTAVEQAEL